MTTGRADSRGFTLVELMVVIVIASILMAIAIPSYKNSIRKSRRTDAKTALLDLAGRERTLLQHQWSVFDHFRPAGLPLVGDRVRRRLLHDGPADCHGRYLAIAVATFALQSRSRRGQATKRRIRRARSFKLNSTGVQSVSGTATDCW